MRCHVAMRVGEHGHLIERRGRLLLGRGNLGLDRLQRLGEFGELLGQFIVAGLGVQLVILEAASSRRRSASWPACRAPPSIACAAARRAPRVWLCSARSRNGLAVSVSFSRSPLICSSSSLVSRACSSRAARVPTVADALGWLEPAVGIVGGPKNRLQGVVIGLPDRLELVVVAAGALHGQPQHARGHDLHVPFEHGESIDAHFVGIAVALAGAVGRVAQEVRRGQPSTISGVTSPSGT